MSDYLERQSSISLVASDEGPALVTVINSSRVVADIKRDLGRIHGTVSFFNVSLC